MENQFDGLELDIDTLDYGNEWRIEFPDLVIVIFPKNRNAIKITKSGITVIIPAKPLPIDSGDKCLKPTKTS